MNEQDRKGPSTGAGGQGAAVQRAVGKQSRTAALGSTPAPVEVPSDVPMGALQLSTTPASAAAASSAASVDDPFGLHLEGSAAQATAARGVESGGGALPHLDTIQASFGKHDVRGVSAHVGGAAADASAALGAEAYATGSSVAFGSSPSLHTAAHEAAHVVQQRAGVSLKGGVGESGDVYEQHADRVADAVVAGQSAEALLDHGPSAGATTSGPSIQKKDGAAPAALPDYGTSADADVQAADGDSEGDKLRKAVLAAARDRLANQTEIVSKAEVEDKRAGNVDFKIMPGVTLKLPLGTPMKNFTTCIEFAGQTFRDGTKAAAGGDAKEQTHLAMGLPTFMLLFNKETELHLLLESFQKIINQWQDDPDKVPEDPKKMKAMDKAKADKAKAEQEKADLEAKGETGDKAKDAATAAQIRAKDQYIAALDKNINFIQGKIDEFRKKIEDATKKLEKVEGVNDAYMKAEEQLPAGNRPKLGEYILTGAAGSQPYGVGGPETKVTLQKGMFKHIAVFDGLGEGKDLPADGKWEQWKTIDGGGQIPTGNQIYVQVEPPFQVLHQAPSPDRPWQSQSSLLGWIDADKLAALSKNAEAAELAGLKKK
jgi:hypothetical protein